MFLVMGITGRVGGATAKHLLARGKEVRALVRNRKKASSWANQGVELVDGDWNDSAAIERGSGASGDFGLKQTRWRAEGRQAAKHKCLTSSRFPSLMRVTGGSPAAEHGLLSADA